jgi:TonB family protein
MNAKGLWRALCFPWILVFLTAHPLGAAGQGVKDVQVSAKKGKFQQAFAQCRTVLAATPSADEMSRLRTLFSKYPRIQESGVAAISSLIDAARTEQDLLRAQSEVLSFARCVKSSVCDPGPLAALQTRFVAAASRLILGAGIPVTFESNLLADWTASTGSVLDDALERRIYQNTMANIAARDPRDTPSVLMADRLFRYLLREPEARKEALPTLERVEWRWSDRNGPLREVYPGLAEERKAKVGYSEATLQFDAKGVDFGTWERPFIRKVVNNWASVSAAGSLKGRVEVSFNVHKDGTITDIVVVGPSKVEVLNTSSLNAIAASSPVQPLPAEYPDEKAHITITFYYNETPPRK